MSRTEKISGDYRIVVEFLIVGFACDPSEITRIVGVNPQRVIHKGERLRRNIGVPAASNRWSFELDFNMSLGPSLDAHVDALLKKIYPHASAFSRLPQESKVLMSCAVYDYGRNVILELRNNTLQKLAELHADLDLDFYDFSDTA